MTGNGTPPVGHSAERAVAFGLLVLFAALFFFRGLFSDAFFVIDFHLTFQPLRTILLESVGHGAPLWSDRLGNGGPVLANPMYAALYPPNLLCLVMSPARALTVLTVLHLVFGAAGAWLLARRLGQSAAAAILVALIVGFNGASVASTSFINLAWTFAWLPWLLVALDRVAGGPGSARVIVLGMVVGAMLILADPFVIAAGCVGSGLWIVSGDLWNSEDRNRIHRRRLVIRTALGLVLGVLVALPSLAAVLGYLPATVRADGFTPEGMTIWSFHPLFGLGLVLPSVFGDPQAVGLDRFWAAALFPQRGAPLLISMYVGGLALAVAVLGAVVRGRRRWMLVVWLAALGLLALGRHGPVYPLLDGVPGFAALRYPMKWMLPAMLPLALLAGRGADAVGRLANDRRSTISGLLPIAGVLALLACVVVAAMPAFGDWIVDLGPAPGSGTGGERIGDARVEAIRGRLQASAAWSMVPLLLAAAAILTMRIGPGSVRIAKVIGVLVMADLMIHNQRLAPVITPDFYKEVPAVAEAVLNDADRGRVFVETPAVVFDPGDAPPTIGPASRRQRELLMGSTGAAFSLRMAFNDDTEGLSTSRYTGLGVLVRSAPVRERMMLVGAAGVSHVVAFGPMAHGFLEPLKVIPGTAGRPIHLYRNRLEQPRVRAVPTLIAFRGNEGFIRVVETGPDDLFSRAALVEVDDLAAAGLAVHDLRPAVLDGPRMLIEQPRLLEDRGHVLRIRTAGDGGWIVLSDVHAPGWTVTVDGAGRSILPVDYAFRAVAVAGGAHEVVFRYRPWW